MESKYTVEYFIKLFSEVPDELWLCNGSLGTEDGRGCALHHCGVRYSHIGMNGSILHEAGAALANLIRGYAQNALEDYETIYRINDDKYNHYYVGSTPKDRMINELLKIKKLQDKESKVSTIIPEPENKIKERIVYVTINPEIKTEAKELIQLTN